MDHEKAVCLNCIDGNVQLPVASWIKNRYQIDCVDMITEPGIVCVLSNLDQSIDEINKKVRHCLETGSVTKLFISGHEHCDFCGIDDAQQKHQVSSAILRVQKDFPGLDVHGLWYRQDGSIEEIALLS